MILWEISAYFENLGENLKSKLRIYYLSYVRCLENDKLIIFSSTPEWYSKSVLDESLIRLMIVDELNNYNDKCEYNFDENCCQ